MINETRFVVASTAEDAHQRFGVWLRDPVSRSILESHYVFTDETAAYTRKDELVANGVRNLQVWKVGVTVTPLPAAKMCPCGKPDPGACEGVCPDRIRGSLHCRCVCAPTPAAS